MLLRALSIEEEMAVGGSHDTADTHLNLCAVLSELGKHQDALQHAQAALVLLQSELLGSALAKEKMSDHAKQRVASMSVCYYNLGVELEFTYQGEASVAMYKKGLGIAENYLGGQHPVAEELRRAVDASMERYHYQIHKKLTRDKQKQDQRAERAQAALAHRSKNNPDAFKYNAEATNKAVTKLQGFCRGIITRKHLYIGFLVPPGPAAAEERLVLVEEASLLVSRVEDLIAQERVPEPTTELSVGAETVAEARAHAVRMGEWRLLKEDGAELQNMARQLELLLSKRGGTVATPPKPIVTPVMTPATRPRTARDLQALRPPQDAFSTRASGADLVLSQSELPQVSEGDVWAKMFAGATQAKNSTPAAGDARIPSSIGRVRAAYGAARPDAKEEAPASGSLDLPPMQLPLSRGSGSRGARASTGSGLGFGFGFGLDSGSISTSLLFGDGEVTGASGEPVGMSRVLQEEEVEQLRSGLDVAIEEAMAPVLEESGLYTPRETGPEAIAEMEAAASSMVVQLYSLLGGEEVKGRIGEIEEARLGKLQAYLTECSLAEMESDTDTPNRLGRAKATVAACEAILKALSLLNEGRLSTSRPDTGLGKQASRPGSRRPISRASAGKVAGSRGNTPGSRPLSRVAIDSMLAASPGKPAAPPPGSAGSAGHGGVPAAAAPGEAAAPPPRSPPITMADMPRV